MEPVPEIYLRLWEENKALLQNGDIQTDPLLYDPGDDRRGISLIFRPPEGLRKKITDFLDAAGKIEPGQYFYPGTDIHLTVMSIVSCYAGFHLGAIQLPGYLPVIKDSLKGIPPFELLFEGITASSSTVMIQGFDKSGWLNTIRDNLRENFKKTNLENSIDKRYITQTAHLTVIRFHKALQQPRAFSSFLSDHRLAGFGTCEVKNIELVFNDWYQRKEVVRKLATFTLNHP